MKYVMIFKVKSVFHYVVFLWQATVWYKGSINDNQILSVNVCLFSVLIQSPL